jgi:hypothetical protein
LLLRQSRGQYKFARPGMDKIIHPRFQCVYKPLRDSSPSIHQRSQRRLLDSLAVRVLDVPDEVVIDGELPVAAVERTRPQRAARVGSGMLVEISFLVETSGAKVAAVRTGVFLLVFVQITRSGKNLGARFMGASERFAEQSSTGLLGNVGERRSGALGHGGR